MTVLKRILAVLLLTVLSIVLFVSLIVFGVAFTADRTALNAGFVTAEINKLDAAANAEALLEQTGNSDLTPDEKALLLKGISRVELVIKEGLSEAVKPVYAYLNGKENNLDIAQALRGTVMNSSYLIKLIDAADIPTLLAGEDATELVRNMVGEESYNELPEDAKYLIPYAADIAANLEPWIKEQLPTVADPVFDYLLGKSQSFKIDLPLAPVKTIVADTLRTDFFKTPPAELAGLPQADLQKYYDDHYSTLADVIPETLSFDQSALGADAQSDITKAMDDAGTNLAQARDYLGTFRMGFIGLILLILLLIGGIILVYRRVKPASLHLGIIFLLCGVPQLIGIMIGKNLLRDALANVQPDQLPARIQTTLSRLASDFLTPLTGLSIAFIIIGAALVVVSIFYRERARRAETSPVVSQ